MAVSAFKDVSFPTDGILDPNTLNQLSGNARWLYERMPLMTYNAYGQVNKTDGLKIACGTQAAAATKSAQMTKTIYFGSFFTPGSHPVVVASLIIPSAQYRAHVIIRGIGVTHPDNRGFNAVIASNEIDSKNNGFPQTVYVNWVAMGY